MDLLDLLDGTKPFALSRWGRREWHALFGEREALLPGEDPAHLPRLTLALWKVLSGRPRYRLARAAGGEHFGDRVPLFLEAAGLDDLGWVDDPTAAVDRDALLELLAGRPLVVVGPAHLHRLRELLPRAVFVDVPPRHAYLRRGETLRETLAALEDIKCQATVTIAAGSTSALLVEDLYRRDRSHKILDVGGLWERLLST
jgi:hypothetical protein